MLRDRKRRMNSVKIHNRIFKSSELCHFSEHEQTQQENHTSASEKYRKREIMEKHLTEKIRKELLEMQDLPYRDFHAKLMPTVDKETVIGIRVPVLRKYARTLAKEEDISSFFNDLPHKYFEENNVHAFLIQQIKDFERCVEEVEKFLPCINNWATCDMMSPKIFKKHKEQPETLLPLLRRL